MPLSGTEFRDWLSESPPHWALVADDLTGAADSGVVFAKAGLRTVWFRSPEEYERGRAELSAFSTATRDAPPAEARLRTRRIYRALEARGLKLIFKKVDSCMRGAVREEIEEALDCWGFATATLCPSLPREGRVVADRLLTIGECEQVRLPASERIRTPDAASDKDLEHMAARLMSDDSASLPAGSSGLAVHWAAALAQLHARRPSDVPLPPTVEPVLCVIGSCHRASLDQIRFAAENGLAVVEEGPRPSPRDRNQIVHLDMTRQDEHSLQPLCDQVAQTPATLFVSGGATARMLLNGLAANGFEIRGEVIPGAPWGTILGGAADGRLLVTKSGGFGGPDALARILHKLQGRAAA